MTEKQWLRCTDPGEMLRAMQTWAEYRKGSKLPGESSPRKQRLFACACCRQFWDLLTDQRSRQAVETAEQFADELVGKDALAAADAAARRAEAKLFVGLRGVQATSSQRAQLTGEHQGAALSAAKAAVCTVARSGLITAVQSAANWIVSACGDLALHQGERRSVSTRRRVEKETRTKLAVLLRDVFGNPFRPVAIDPAWLTWRSGTVPRLAQSLYAERGFTDLPILADALEEAGCTDAVILGHCRQPGEHVRGCWVVDFCLGKV